MIKINLATLLYSCILKRLIENCSASNNISMRCMVTLGGGAAGVDYFDFNKHTCK